MGRIVETVMYRISTLFWVAALSSSILSVAELSCALYS